MKSRTVFGIFVCGIFDILGWIFGVWHNRGCPRIFPEGQPAEIIVRIFKIRGVFISILFSTVMAFFVGIVDFDERKGVRTYWSTHYVRDRS